MKHAALPCPDVLADHTAVSPGWTGETSGWSGAGCQGPVLPDEEMSGTAILVCSKYIFVRTIGSLLLFFFLHWSPCEALNISSTYFQFHISLFFWKMCLVQHIMNIKTPELNTNLVVHNSIKIWGQFRKHFNWTSICSFSPIMFNHLFAPSLIDQVFAVCHRSGLIHFHDLLTDDDFASFKSLREDRNLPKSHYFRCLQVRSFALFDSCPYRWDKVKDGKEKLEKWYRKTHGKISHSAYTHLLSALDMAWSSLRLSAGCITLMTDCQSSTLTVLDVSIPLFLLGRTFWSCPSLCVSLIFHLQNTAAWPFDSYLRCSQGWAKAVPPPQKRNCLCIIAPSDTAQLEGEEPSRLCSLD